ncbi:HAD family hydrolase [Gordonia bronchialis]|uniref:HAD family hydrolase n=1 Tax=Gordonia bronchialis TaxID=2054 RepID=UPI001C499558|nr:HAD family hydrolase [Gordonia bronchialis]MCC3323499.1 HAD hydrolase-like protein [Gordonia bronchialis]
MNLYLFDIDGTLVGSADGHKDAFAVGFSKVFGIFASIHEVDFRGCTDFQIIAMLAELHTIRLTQESIANLESVMSEYYADVAQNLTIEPIRGARDALLSIRDSGNSIELLSGNLSNIAEIKLKKAGIFDLFESGTYGDYADSRVALV